ncbi:MULTISPECIES: hypothetical protein [Vibrio]|uniref:Uncharacterized protein n=2 Tax=Vibrio TaxID=662 RepID=A0A4U1YW27_9VIBR|nr:MULTISPECIES: hypothetical protein [Vibrio]RZR38150.1 hypothetical protein D8T33_01055 [Vibrio vulnificus]TKF25470.1 hypothetical protein FCV50_22220 [Vibrio kanaloae]TWD71392.1 hypothetical protein FB444_101303 [Vibrio crassostreae]
MLEDRIDKSTCENIAFTISENIKMDNSPQHLESLLKHNITENELVSMYSTIKELHNNPMISKNELSRKSKLRRADFEYFVGDYADFKTKQGFDSDLVSPLEPSNNVIFLF